MMGICIKQHLMSILGSVQKKVKQHWCWVGKSVAYLKKCVLPIYPKIIHFSYVDFVSYYGHATNFQKKSLEQFLNHKLV